MSCYYRNGISYGANRREFEDQSVIKGKFDQIGIRPIRVSHFGELERAFREERKEEKKKKRKGKDCYGLYGLLWISIDFWTFVWILVCSSSRV